ncbi:MAG: 1-acyl-sn-glycerol-3-phosphate acyltransferase [Pseudomonadota bacterium]|nr:1-acyl-sn-glycerol-3-phosphate acyltransferase [Pseudomonadota bacterium]
MNQPVYPAARPQDVLRSLVFYPVFCVGSVVYVLVALLAARLRPRSLRRICNRWAAFHRDCARHILGIDVRVEGIVPQGAVMVALKHESQFEAIDLPMMLPHPVVFAKAELLRLPGWGRVAAGYGVVAVERDQGASALRKMVAAARRLTATTRGIAIFPEGTRIPHGTRAPLQAGFAGLYKLIGLPVVPVAVNSGPLYHRRWKRSGMITLRFGETIPVGLPREEIEARVLTAINALNEVV